MTFDTFRALVAEHLPAASGRGRQLAVPVWARRSADLLTPVAAFLALREAGTFGFLLESVEGGERLARYSFLGKKPYLVIESRGERSRVHRPAGAYRGDGAPHGVETLRSSTFDALGDVLDRVDQARVPELPRFTGGAVGFVGYDAVRQLESLTIGPPDLLGLPDAVWAFYDLVAAFDHVRHQLVLMATVFVNDESDLEAVWDNAQDRLAELEFELSDPVPPGEPIRLLGEPTSSVERETFEAAVQTAQERITEGDIFQVVLSQRFATPIAGDPFNLYRALRQVNPSPYLFYVDVDGLEDPTPTSRSSGRAPRSSRGSSPGGATAGPKSSPSRGRARAAPRRGRRRARRRASGGPQGARRAPHARGPRPQRPGRVADLGTVRVERCAEVERYSHVMHLGERDRRRSASGERGRAPSPSRPGPCRAPKVRAMEIIDGWNRSAAARTPAPSATRLRRRAGHLHCHPHLVVEPDTAYVQAGAGVVADSDPASEFDETRTRPPP